MIVQRWFIIPTGMFTTPTEGIVSVEGPLDVYADGSELWVFEFDRKHLRQIQRWVANMLGGETLPSLTAPADSAGPKLTEKMTLEGFVPGNRDDIQQCLRGLKKLRNKNYDVDKPF